MNLRENISGKKIIFFSVRTFNLENEIINKLKECGASVEYYDERPSNSNFTKGIIRLKRSFYEHRIKAYYKNILKRTARSSYDFLFVNRGEVIPAFFLKDFKVQHPECLFIFYTWDSFKNHCHPVSILKYFDKKFTFDSNDAKEHNIGFRPLFFLDTYSKVQTTSNEKLDYDLLFLGTAHSDRYRIGSDIKSWCTNENLRMFSYYYMHGRLVYFYKKLFDKSFQKFVYSKLSFKSLSSRDIVKLYSRSKVILDINHPGQKGLTMRTFESIGARKKLITTNSEVLKYPFYNSNNILVIDRDNIIINKEFFKTPYQEIDELLYSRMSILGWIEEIFEVEKEYNWNNDIE